MQAVDALVGQAVDARVGQAVDARVGEAEMPVLVRVGGVGGRVGGAADGGGRTAAAFVQLATVRAPRFCTVLSSWRHVFVLVWFNLVCCNLVCCNRPSFQPPVP